MLRDRLEATSTPSFYGHIKLLVSEAGSLMKLAHQHFLVENEKLSSDLANDARDRVQSAGAMLSAGEDCDIIKTSFTVGSRRLLYVNYHYPRQTFVLASVPFPVYCFFCNTKIEFGQSEVRHVGYIVDATHGLCSGCNCTYHEIIDTTIADGS